MSNQKKSKMRTARERMRRFEEFEQRIVMSAAPLSDMGLEGAALNLNGGQPAVNPQFEFTTQLNDTHSQTGVDAVHQNYGFDGTGQTVAVIDSGIAWDHLALGGGYGENARVVGGWDFAENDSNPYDDGPAGFHGSHVSGIVGSSDANNLGVAPGVDLVGLRVFDDSGAGNLEWVEQALQWVHDHRNDFENPITTVNLSIGTEWNSNTTPNWATLEEEFAQLEADGIFISVAAGNSFQNYNTAGLSYPAVSSHVVPVASHGADGDLSDFSQRIDGILAAPGESIRSSVPDHLLGGTQHNSFLGASGTSMAAPYVAGASALLRQANEFMGNTGINQDLLLQQFRETADHVFDSATGGYYYRLNLQAAIDAVVIDRYSDTWESATAVGGMQQGTQISGTIGTLTDRDVFDFVANQTGRITLDINTTHNLNALVDVQNIDAQLSSNQVSFDVVAGESYKFSMETSTGTGHYQIEASYAAGIESEDWGSVDARDFSGQEINGQQWYRLTAANEGILSIDASLRNSSPLQLRVYDADMNEVAARHGSGGDVRIDVGATAGQTFFVKALANDGVADFRVNNLVSLTGGKLVVGGTSGNDNVMIESGSTLLIDVNGMEYQFDAGEIDSIVVAGGGGNDTIQTRLDSGASTVTLNSGRFRATTSSVDIVAAGFENISINSGGGHDRLVMTGTEGNDNFTNNGSAVRMTSGSHINQASGFDVVTVVASGGVDNATLNGTAGDDVFAFRDGRAAMRTGDFVIVVNEFDGIIANGNGGDDIANLFDSNGDDQFIMRPDYAKLTTPDAVIRASGFERINAFSRAGQDSLVMHDSAANDSFIRNSDKVVMFNGNYMNLATGFTQVVAYATGGENLAILNGTHLSDSFHANNNSAQFVNSKSSITVNGFDKVVANGGSAGYDRAYLTGTSGADVVYADASSTTIVSGGAQTNRTVGFDVVHVDTLAGIDQAYLQGSAGREILHVNQDQVDFDSTLQKLRMRGMTNTRFEGGGGADDVIFSDFETLDLLSAIGDEATAVMKKHRVVASDFDFLEATSADLNIGLSDIDAVDFLYNLHGDWMDV